MSFKPKKNKVLSLLHENKVPLGMQIYTANPSMIEIISNTGFDFYMLCMEHTRINIETVEHCIRTADAANITTIVRVAENNSSLIREVIESGAQGVIIPHIKSKEDVIEAKNSLRYPPEGKLGMCPAIRSANYTQTNWDEYIQYHNNHTMLIALIEDVEGVENAEEIFYSLKPNVDAVMFGRADLAQSLVESGKKVDWHAKYISEAYKKLLALSQKTNIPLIAVPWPELTVESAKESINDGAKICLFSIDQLLFHNLCLEISQGIKGK